MSDALKALQYKLKAALIALAEAEARSALREAEHRIAIREAEDLCKQVEQAHRQWLSALDMMDDPIFVHDKAFRILRCNQAYQRRAAMAYPQIIGAPYYEVFPKTHAPLPNCRREVEETAGDKIEEEVQVGATTYRSRAYAVTEESGRYLYSVHVLEDINERLSANRALRESELQYRRLFEAVKDGILMLDGETGKIMDANPYILDLLACSFEECTSRMLWEIGLIEDVEASKAAFEELRIKGIIRHDDLQLETRDGRRIEVEFVGKLYAVGARKVIQCNIRTITGRKEAEKYKNYLAAIVESSGDAIIGETLDGVITSWNMGAEKMYGYTASEALGQAVSILIPARRMDELSRNLKIVRAGGTVEHIETVRRTKTGKIIDVSLSISPIRDEGGAVLGAATVARDISGRKADESRLKMFRALLDKSNDAIEVLDPETFRLLDVNETACRSLGYSRDELLTMSILDIDPEVDEQKSKQLDEELHARGSVVLETRHRRKDGSTFPVEVGISQVKLDRDYRITVARDITERKRAETMLRDSEARLRAIFDGALDGIAMVDLEFRRFAAGNSALCRMLGYSAEEIAQLEVADIHPQQDWPHVLEQFDKQARGEIQLAEDTPVKRKDGSVFYADINTATVQFGGRSFIVGIFRDITERRQAEADLLGLNAELESKVAERTADLERARSDAERANQAKSAFLAAMSHEIRSPMNGVIGMLEVLQQSSLTPRQLETTNIIHESAFSLLAIVNDILDFSRIEAGKLQIDSIPLSVAAVVEGACATMDLMAMRSGIELTLFTDPDIPATVLGDAGRLRQILVNLTNNAVKFSSGQDRRGQVSVRALLVESTPGQVTLEFRVSDNGIGMDEATIARLFTAFSQADSSTTRTFGGTGLGLAISRQLTHLMGGEITLQSETNKGSLFIVRMPFALPMQHSAAAGAKSTVAGLITLVVGGAQSMADDLVAYLTHGGARVERVNDLAAAQEWIALHWLDGHPPAQCVVVIDTVGNKMLLDKVKTAAHAHPEHETQYVVIGRGKRRKPRWMNADLMLVDGNIITRGILLKAVEMASGRAKELGYEVPHGQVEAAVEPLTREAARLQGRLILIAEDNEINREVIKQQLTLLGQMADIASNGIDALELWRSGDHALLFADLHMPKMDGYELTSSIRAAEKAGASGKPRIPIVAFTANALKGEAEHCLAVGMDDYLSKPVQLVNLKAMLKKWLPVVPAETIPAKAAPVGKADAGVAVDVNVLRALVGDDETIIREFLREFRAGAVKIAVELRAACTEKQPEVTGALAHKLKSSARAVGALELGELCERMEKAGKAGKHAALLELLPGFEQALASVESYLDGH